MEESAAGACCKFAISLSALGAYVAALVFTIQSNWSCCPDFIVALIATSGIAVLDRLVQICKCIPEGVLASIASGVLKLAIVLSLIATLPQTSPCEHDGWLVFLITLASLSVVGNGLHMIYLVLQVFGVFKYTKVPGVAAEM